MSEKKTEKGNKNIDIISIIKYMDTDLSLMCMDYSNYRNKL